MDRTNALVFRTQSNPFGSDALVGTLMSQERITQLVDQKVPPSRVLVSCIHSVRDSLRPVPVGHCGLDGVSHFFGTFDLCFEHVLLNIDREGFLVS